MTKTAHTSKRAESRKVAEALLAPPREPTERQLAAKKLYAETITHN